MKKKWLWLRGSLFPFSRDRWIAERDRSQSTWVGKLTDDVPT